ncbi:MAG: acyl-CoA thioesterase [Desulfobacterota bacterium]|nr:acyl-CoA thioesterase [Thermodesulfobacteriota bacterium]MDW8001152.1 thioesterase family protein [Deltaproteobacteria bacterium]
MEKDSQRKYIDVPIRVRYADTDRMGIVYYGTYPIYFEIARSEYLRHLGFTYRELEERGYYLVVTELIINYLSSATYDDLLIVRTSVSELKSRSLKFEYIITKDGKDIVRGYTRHVCVDTKRKPVSFPSEFLEILKDATA